MFIILFHQVQSQSLRVLIKSLFCSIQKQFQNPRNNTGSFLDQRSMVDPARPRPPQVFVNSGATELPDDFIKHLVSGLTDLGILNVFMDRDDWWGRDLDRLFTCIEESTIALVIFSPCYPETEWCLDELVKMKERVNNNKLLVIPIFFNVSKNDVRNFEGEFGDRFMELRKRYTKYKYDPFRVQRWETSVMTISRMEPSLTWETQRYTTNL